MKFHYDSPPLEKCFGLPGKNPLFPPLEKFFWCPSSYTRRETRRNAL